MSSVRDMGDATHGNVSHLVARRSELDLVAGYGTGSPDIRWTDDDWAQFPGIPHVVIDQGYTGSPLMTATVRDCEEGAWLLSRAVNRSGWNVERPTLYLGYPDTAEMAYDLGWRGDVWLVHPQDTAPTAPPPVPNGLHVVSVQWAYPGTHDWSAVFDPSWPYKSSTPSPTPTGNVNRRRRSSMPQLLPKTTDATPIVLGDGATGVRFFSNLAVSFSVDVRTANDNMIDVNLNFDKVQKVDKPDGINAFVVHRQEADAPISYEVCY
jgi:hypothetical protein